MIHEGFANQDKLRDLAEAQRTVTGPESAKGGEASLDSPHQEIENSLKVALVEHGYSSSSVRQYVYSARRFLKFHDKIAPCQLTATEAFEFLEHLESCGTSASAKNAMCSALILLYRFVLKTGHAELTHLKRSTVTHKPQPIPSHVEIERTLALLDSAFSLQFRLLNGSGLRLQECMRLRVGDVNFATNRILVRDERGYEDRMTILRNEDVPALQAHLNRRKAQYKFDLSAGKACIKLPEAYGQADPTSFELQYVFPALSCRQNPQPGSLLQRAIKEAAQMAEISTRITPQSLRHAFAARLIESGYDIKTVQRLLGHERPSTTRRNFDQVCA